MANLFEFVLNTQKEGFYNITKEVEHAIAQSGVAEGIALVFCPHTTGAITITENTDPMVCADILLGMMRAFPDYSDYKHSEGNSFAHLKSSAMGCEMSLIISGGWPLLGAWQAIYFCEFDGPRERRFYVKVMNG